MSIFSDWKKGKEDKGLGLSDGLEPRFYRFGNKAPKKPWDPREANLMTFKVNHTTGARLADRIERVKVERFFQAPLDPAPTLPYLTKDTRQIRHLNTDNPRPPPFPFLRRPLPPPFPLPVFEGSSDSIDIGSNASEVPKIPSMVRNLSEEPEVDLEKMEAEREVYQPVELKEGKIKINIHPNMDNFKLKPVLQLAQQTMEWEMHLRDRTLRKTSSTYNGVRKSASRRLHSKLKKSHHQLMPFKNYTEDAIAKKRLEDFKIREAIIHRINDDSLDTTIYYQMTPKLRHIPNRTIQAAETGMEHVQHIMRQGPRFPEIPNQLKFYVRDGIPSLTEPKPNGNTFGSPETLRIPFSGTGTGSKRPRKYLVDMVGFNDRDISLEIDGHLILVTGRRPKERNRNRRHVTESIALPPGLSLNQIRIARDYTGRIVIEELLDF